MQRIAEDLEKAKHPNPPKNLYDKEYPCRLREALAKEGVRSYAAGGSVDSDYRDPTPDEMQQFGQPPGQGEYRDPTPDEMQQFGRRPDQPEVSTLGAAGIGAASGVLPAAGAIPGAVAGSELGTAIGALGGPAAPFTVPAGALAGGIGGAMLGGAAMNAVQNWLMDKLGIGEKVREYQQAAREQHGTAELAGELAPNLAAFQPSQVAKGIASRLVPGSVGAGLEAGQEYSQGEEFDPSKIALAGGAMASLTTLPSSGKGSWVRGKRASSAALSRLPQAAQAAIAAGRARAGSYWGGKAQEGQPGRPDLQPKDQPDTQLDLPLTGSAKNPEPEQFDLPFNRKPRPGTAPDNRPAGPEEVQARTPPVTTEVIADKQAADATPAHGSPGVNASLATSHAMPPPSLNGSG